VSVDMELKIEHYRTGTVHYIDSDYSGDTTRTLCGKLLLYSDQIGKSLNGKEVDCGSCQRVKR